MVNPPQLLIGMGVLLFGGVSYFIDRPPNRTYVLTWLPIWLSGYGALPRLPSPVGSSLPTFVHALSFSMITASLCRPSAPFYAAICLVWFCVNVTFEIGQGPGRSITQMIPMSLDGVPFLGYVRRYFLLGTFDPLDLLAAFWGSATALPLLLLTHNRTLEKWWRQTISIISEGSASAS
jgi:hypothetical protein